MTPKLSKKARRLGFKTPEEYTLFLALKKKHLDVHHNVNMLGTEIDLFIPPNIIIEIGYRDNYLIEKWDESIEKGYEFIYISNIEVNNPEILERYVDNITRLVEEANVNSYRWNVTGFSSHKQRDGVCYNEVTDDGLNGILECIESALREGAISVIVTKKSVLRENTNIDLMSVRTRAFVNL